MARNKPNQKRKEQIRRHTLEIDGQRVPFFRLNRDLAKDHYNLGNILAHQGQTDLDIAEYRAALRINPIYAEAQINLGVSLSSQGRCDLAIAEYRAALRIKDLGLEVLAAAHLGLGNALQAQW